MVLMVPVLSVRSGRVRAAIGSSNYIRKEELSTLYDLHANGVEIMSGGEKKPVLLCRERKEDEEISKF